MLGMTRRAQLGITRRAADVGPSRSGPSTVDALSCTVVRTQQTLWVRSVLSTIGTRCEERKEDRSVAWMCSPQCKRVFEHKDETRSDRKIRRKINSVVAEV